MTETLKGWVDAHLHLDLYAPAERKRLLEQAWLDGVTGIVAVSMDLASCQVNRELAMQEPQQRILPAYGYHPEQVVPDRAALETLIGWIRERAAAGERFAIGEVGLPYYRRESSLAAGEPFDAAPYVELLERFVALAAELRRPIVLHAVYDDAWHVCDLLERYGVQAAHFHWFKGPPETVRRMIASGYSISVTPDVAYEPEIQTLVAQYPLELIMAETDGPWPFEGPYAGRQTVPGMTADVVRHIARLKGLDEAEAVRRIRDNTYRFYGL